MNGQRDDQTGSAADRGAPALKIQLSPYLPMIVASILMALAVFAAAATILSLHERVKRNTTASLGRLALVIADQTSRSFQSVDLILKEITDRVAAPPDGVTRQLSLEGNLMHRFLAHKAVGVSQVANLILIDAEGNFVNSSLTWPVQSMSLADREQFRHFRDNATRDLFVSEPVRSRPEGTWTVYLARRLEDPDGRFLGVAQAAVRLRHFEDFYKSVSLGEGGTIALLRQDGVMLASYPEEERGAGKRQPVGDRAADEGLPRNGKAGSTGPMRFTAFHAVPGFPLTVSTALTEKAVLDSWRRDTIMLVLGTSGAVAGILLLLLSLARKIRRMRRSEQLLAKQNLDLQRSQQLLVDAQRIGRLGHWASNGFANEAVCSAPVFEIAGVAPEPMISFETLLSWIHPDDVGDFFRSVKAARLEGHQLAHEHRWVRPDDSIRWVRLETDLRDAPSDQLFGPFGIVQDITERKEAECVAEEARHHLFDAIESMSQGFILFDSEDRFILANTHFREMFPSLTSLLQPGVRYGDLLRASLDLGLVDSAQAMDWVAAWHQSGSKPMEHCRGGTWIQFVEHRTSYGGTAGLMTDITEFKRIQGTLEQKLKDLEQIRQDLEAQKRELEATSADLVSARDAAESASRAKSDFLAIMSHEIRTPLSGMVGMIDLLRQTPLSDEQERYATLAKESSDGLLSVVNDILDFSKLEAGRLTPEAIDFDVGHLIQGVGLLESKARAKGQTIVVSQAPDTAKWLKGDPTRIRQVLLNLVNNAIKFTESGRIGVHASHRDLGEGHVELRIEVVDGGIGMSPATQAQLFKPFVQADTSISRKYGGSGLGLAICKRLCNMMDGDIGVESTEGMGSTFWFTVRCRYGKPPVVEAPSLVPAADRSIRILVAEDSPIIATLISSLLCKQGFARPDMVVNGKEAVAAVARKTYDVVLMDVQMPEMDGMSATAAIRASEGPERDLPIIALTANAVVGQREKYLAIGMNDYVTKPIQPGVLFAAIERWTSVEKLKPSNPALLEGQRH